MKKILITGALHPLALERFEQEKELLVSYQPDLKREKILEIIGDYDCILTRSETDIDQILIDKGVKLSVIARAAVGIGNIDIPYATKKGILVFNTPGKNTNSAAELTVMLTLAVIRNLTKAHKSMEANKWDRHTFTGTELMGKTVGLIGLGNVGHRVAKFLNSFDCRVLCYDPYVSKSYCEKHKTEQVSFEDLVKHSDIISIHTPKNKETINMISEKDVENMKDGVILINAARGGLMNEDAILKGLEAKKILGYGVDTWDIEPVVEHPLKSFQNVVMTPHIGASTIEAQQRIAQSVSESAIKALKGGIVSSQVNLPDVHVFEGSQAPKYSALAGRLGMFSRQFIDQDYCPKRINFQYRGNLKTEDWALIKLSFLREFLRGTTDTSVSYVNVLQITEGKGIQIEETADKDFSDYESAIRIEMVGDKENFNIGGTVFGDSRLRLSYINGFIFETEPRGNILTIENKDVPGVIGFVGTLLADHGININQFELSRKGKEKKAMALVVVDEDVSNSLLLELEKNDRINRVRKIVI